MGEMTFGYLRTRIKLPSSSVRASSFQFHRYNPHINKEQSKNSPFSYTDPQNLVAKITEIVALQ